MLSPVCLTFLGRRMCDTLSAISAEWHMKSEGSPNLESHETITKTLTKNVLHKNYNTNTKVNTKVITQTQKFHDAPQ